MKNTYLLLIFIILGVSYTFAQTTTPINADRMASFTVPASGDVADSLLPYYGDLGVRRVIVADADGDGDQEILATDYSNGGRVHVLEVVQDSLLEIVWSSPAEESSSGSTPRFIQVGDCDGDGNLEIIFPQRNYVNETDDLPGRIALFEWNGTDWGTEAAWSITPTMIAQAGGRESVRFHREVLTVYDFDGDGRTEIIPHGDAPRQDVLILGVNFDFPGFASIYIEGGKPGTQTNGGDWGAGGSFWNAVPADIDGDGQLEIVNHTYNYYGLWSIDVDGTPDSYTYPEATDNADAKAKGVYHEYTPGGDAVSYFGVQPVDVDGDGKDEIVGTQYGNAHALAMISFPETASDTYIWTEDSQTENYAELFTSGEIAALAGNTVAELWPIVGGDVNQDGKDEIYTGGGKGLNLVAIQYKGEGDLLDPASYDMNLVYNGEGGEVFATWNIYNGKATYTYDTTFVTQDSIVIDTTASFDASIIDTVKEETPFTAYIWADNVDLDNDGKLEIVLSEQSVYDSIEVKVYNWNDTIPGSVGYWDLDLEKSYNVFNEYRQTIRVLEYNSALVGFKEQLYGIITPDDYKLEQNYPNPFNPSTTINFSLPIDKKITLKVFDMVGQEVKSLINDSELKKGNHQVVWDGTNNFGSKVASGNYIARLTFGNFTKSIKMTMLK